MGRGRAPHHMADATARRRSQERRWRRARGGREAPARGRHPAPPRASSRPGAATEVTRARAPLAASRRPSNGSGEGSSRPRCRLRWADKEDPRPPLAARCGGASPPPERAPDAGDDRAEAADRDEHPVRRVAAGDDHGGGSPRTQASPTAGTSRGSSGSTRDQDHWREAGRVALGPRGRRPAHVASSTTPTSRVGSASAALGGERRARALPPNASPSTRVTTMTAENV